MILKDQMNKIYSSKTLDQIPWNFEHPPKILVELLEKEIIKPCRIIDLGCGAGNYILYLASLGFDATGIDFSEAAIKIATKAALEKNIKCTLEVDGVQDYTIDEANLFNCAYDWEVLHHVFPEEREQYVHNVSRLLKPEGHYFSLCFSEESSQFGGKGKYRKTPLGTELYFSSQNEMKLLYEEEFDIQELKTVDVEGKFGPQRAIYAFMTKKAVAK
ncbi:MAG: class I SAM-dependent methyltransferase [Fibrobacterales bacterium]